MKPKLGVYLFVEDQTQEACRDITICDVCIEEERKYNKELGYSMVKIIKIPSQYCAHDNHKELVAQAEEAARAVSKKPL